jgi:hypothetical protein
MNPQDPPPARFTCYTQEEIAEREAITHQAVDLVLQEMASLPKLAESDKAAAEHLTDFDPPLYNVWKQTEHHNI